MYLLELRIPVVLDIPKFMFMLNSKIKFLNH